MKFQFKFLEEGSDNVSETLSSTRSSKMSGVIINERCGTSLMQTTRDNGPSCTLARSINDAKHDSGHEFSKTKSLTTRRYITLESQNRRRWKNAFSSSPPARRERGLEMSQAQLLSTAIFLSFISIILGHIIGNKCKFKKKHIIDFNNIAFF